MAEFASKPLILEWVFLNPQFIDVQCQKEVCELILQLKTSAIVIQMKCQEDPTTRTGQKLENWVIKQAKIAANQLRGSLSTIQNREYWCDHQRRGRVNFLPGELTPVHGLVLVEHFSPCIPLAEDCSLEFGNVPVAYMTPNDLLNLVLQLRTFPDIQAYLSERAKLPVTTRRIVGNEKTLFQYYVEHDSSFAGWRGYDEETPALKCRVRAFQALMQSKMDADKAANYLEYVVHSISTRDPAYARELSPETLQWFEKPDQRKRYLSMQEELCTLRLSERRAVGEYFLKMSAGVDSARRPALLYGHLWLDSKPDFLYVLAASRGNPRQKLLIDCRQILVLELIKCNKTSGMLIVDDDSAHYHIVLLRNFVPNDELKAAALKLRTLREYDVLCGFAS